MLPEEVLAVEQDRELKSDMMRSLGLLHPHAYSLILSALHNINTTFSYRCSPVTGISMVLLQVVGILTSILQSSM